MLKVVAFMKQVAEELRMGGNFGTAHVYRSSTNAIIAYCGEGDFSFDEVTPEWLKGFEIHLRGKGFHLSKNISCGVQSCRQQ